MFLSTFSFILVVFSIQVEAVGKAIPPAALWCESCATREFYNDAAKLKWVNKNDGDWIDADGVEQGSKPFATVDVPDKDVATEFNFDVAVIVNRWLSKEIAEQGFALRCTNKVRWRAKDAPETSEHARLELESPSGEKVVAKVIGDVHLTPSTYTNRGADAAVSCESGVLALFRFDVSGIETWSSVKSAQLVLTSFQVYSGLGKASVFLPDAGRAYLKGVAPVSTGFAVNYKDDKNIASDESVFYATSFEEDEWLTVSANQRTSVGDADIGNTDNINAVKPDYSEFGFSPWQGNALRVLWRKGSNYGGTVSYKFAKNGPEPDHAFFRYYIRLADDWGTMSDGGKMAGFAGRNNGRCGWGGRRSDGQCWSARGTYAKSINGDDNPLNTATPFGNYQYHIDQATTYGDVNYWTDSLNGNLFKNQWHCVEQEVQMNTVGQADGLIRAWVDGRLAYTRQNMRWRTIADLHIEEVWMNWYHGGTATIPEDMHLFVDSLVVAKKRIGCMSSSSATLPPTNPTSAPSPTDAPSTNAPPSNDTPATSTPATGTSGAPASSSSSSSSNAPQQSVGTHTSTLYATDHPCHESKLYCDLLCGQAPANCACDASSGETTADCGTANGLHPCDKLVDKCAQLCGAREVLMCSCEDAKFPRVQCAPSSTAAAETTSPSSIVTVAPIVVLIVSLLTLLIL